MDGPIPTPSKENEWLGFCPSAVKLQNGDKKGALKKRTEYHDSYATSGVSTYQCSMKGCAFGGHVSVDFVWKVVMKDEKLGLQCRWAFLAKSHMSQGIVTGKQYMFQCPICIFSQGHAEGRIWKGTSIFLDHVSTHRGKDIPPEVLHKLNIINDYVAEEKESFDINLFPPGFDTRARQGSSSESSLALSRASTHHERHPLERAPTHHSVLDKVWGRKDSSAIDIGSGMARSNTNYSSRDRADSVVAVTVPGAERADEGKPAEPWSTGLSDFHREKEGDYLSPDF